MAQIVRKRTTLFLCIEYSSPLCFNACHDSEASASGIDRFAAKIEKPAARAKLFCKNISLRL
jgi:hypothetical protein